MDQPSGSGRRGTLGINDMCLARFHTGDSHYSDCCHHRGGRSGCWILVCSSEWAASTQGESVMKLQTPDNKFSSAAPNN
eukprot:5203822-Amphidinium_carterae.1